MKAIRRKKRQVSGILILDKPAGCTSNHILQKVKHLYFASKAGHTGSLDPIATGVLPICLGEATKFSHFLLDSDKSYRTDVQLGVAMDTGDCTGNIVSQSLVPELSIDQVEAVLNHFKGEQMQLPSIYSALKYQGRPMYEYARKGIEVPRQPRPINISELVLEAKTSDTLTLRVSCSKGTYIRSLVEDIGQKIGCGAHVMTLDRLTCGPFNKSESIAFPDLETLVRPKTSSEKGLPDFELANLEAIDQALRPVSNAVPDCLNISLDSASAEKIMLGQQVEVANIAGSGFVKLFKKEQFLGVGEIIAQNKVAPKRLIQSQG